MEIQVLNRNKSDKSTDEVKYMFFPNYQVDYV